MKGQGLSITTIVVAAIALLVLVVLVAVFTGQFGGFAKGTRECTATPNAECLTDAQYTAQIESGAELTELFGKSCTTPAESKCYVTIVKAAE